MEISTAEKPLVTIGIPSFNNEKTIEYAVRSILMQTYQNWEIIIIIDGSTDQSVEVLKQFSDLRIKVIVSKANMGVTFRRNQAVQLGKGEYFTFIDGDDISFPSRIQKQVDFLQRHSDIDLIGTGILIFNAEGKVVGRFPTPTIHEQICKRPWSGIMLGGATFMGKRQWFLDNPYRNEMKSAEDQELLLRTYQRSRFAAIEEPLYGYRVEGVYLKKNLKSRYYWLKAIMLNAWPNKEYILLMKAILCSVLKMTIDIIAIGSGLNYMMIKQRGLQIDARLIKQWEEIWEKCNFHTENGG